MSYDDFVREYQRLEICFLGPDSAAESAGHAGKRKGMKWEGKLIEGAWKRRVNAGGCKNFREYLVHLRRLKYHIYVTLYLN